eukprot:scaffold162967_cov28-Prasinocladus_malaysianus.AAC.1
MAYSYGFATLRVLVRKAWRCWAHTHTLAIYIALSNAVHRVQNWCTTETAQDSSFSCVHLDARPSMNLSKQQHLRC